METTAAYWEPRIKTYGFQTVRGLSLLEVTIDPEGIASLGHALVRMGDEGIRSHLTFSRPCSGGLEVCFLIRHDPDRLARERFEQVVGRNADKFAHRLIPADLVFFQGPHFGDRYGIADVTLAALAGKGVEMICMVCSGASISIVVPEGKAEEAVLVLSETFEIPKVLPRKSSEASRT